MNFVDTGADGDDGAGEFVAEDLGRLDVALEDFFDVGAADAAGGDFDEDFARADFGDGDFFDEDDSLFAEDAGAHRFRDGGRECGGGGAVVVCVGELMWRLRCSRFGMNQFGRQRAQKNLQEIDEVLCRFPALFRKLD